MRALIINSVCKNGSTGKIAYNLHLFIKEKGHESIVCYGRGNCYPDEEDLFKIDTDFEVYAHAALARLTGLQGFFSNIATNNLLRLIHNYKPDAVFLLNLHGYYLNEFCLLGYLKKNKIRTIYVMMDEYPFLGKCCYSYDCEKYRTQCEKCPRVSDYPKSLFFDQSRRIFAKKAQIYKEYSNIVFISAPYVISIARQSALIGDKRLIEIDTGIDLDNTFYIRATDELREYLRIPVDNKIILNVAKSSDERKGVEYFFSASELLINEKISFINVGFNCEAKDCPQNVIPIRYVKDQDELATYYSLADLLVCTSLADAMPNVCLEALGCGTPICGFNISGTPYVASQEFGEFVRPRDINALAISIMNTPIKTKVRAEACRKYAQSRYSNRLYFYKLLEFLTEQ